MSFKAVLIERHRVVSEGNISVNLNGFGRSSVIALESVHVGCSVFDSSTPLSTS